MQRLYSLLTRNIGRNAQKSAWSTLAEGRHSWGNLEQTSTPFLTSRTLHKSKKQAPIVVLKFWLRVGCLGIQNQRQHCDQDCPLKYIRTHSSSFSLYLLLLFHSCFPSSLHVFPGSRPLYQHCLFLHIAKQITDLCLCSCNFQRHLHTCLTNEPRPNHPPGCPESLAEEYLVSRQPDRNILHSKVLRFPLLLP